MEVWVIGHVFLNPGPAMDLLVRGRYNEEATGRIKEWLLKQLERLDEAGGGITNLFLLSRTTLQSFSYPPLSFNMPVWTMCPTGTSKSLAHRCCNSSRAWFPVACSNRAKQKAHHYITKSSYYNHYIIVLITISLYNEKRLTVNSNLVKEDMSMTQTASLQHFTSAPTMSNQSGL